MRIQVITKDNGFGMSKDIQVIREALEPQGHTVDFTPVDRPRKGVRYDWNIHNEHVNPQHFASARVNAIVPNPDWFEAHWVSHLGMVDVVIAKTRDTERIFKSLHREVKYTGWTSPDTDARIDYSKPAIIHAAGNSSMKGTEAVLQAMRTLKDIPATVIWNKRSKTPVPPNVKFHFARLNERDFQGLRTAAIHLCPSTYEGFGHYINEARSMGAMIVSTSAAPMNELVTSDFGILCPVQRRVSQHHLSPQYHVEVEALSQCIRMAWEHCVEHGTAIGARARLAYETDRAAFHTAINELIR